MPLHEASEIDHAEMPQSAPQLDEDDWQELRRISRMTLGYTGSMYGAQPATFSSADTVAYPPWLQAPASQQPPLPWVAPPSTSGGTVSSRLSANMHANNSLPRNLRTTSVIMIDEKHAAQLAAQMRAEGATNNAVANPAPPGIVLMPTAPQEKFHDLRSALKRHRRLVKVYIVIFLVLALILAILSLSGNMRMLWYGGLNGGTGLLGGGRGFTFPGLPMSVTGDGNLYEPSGMVGACNWPVQNSQLAAGLSSTHFGTWVHPTDSPMCGACIAVTGPSGTVKVHVVDVCSDCFPGDVNLTPAGFNQIAQGIQGGAAPITWTGC